MILLIQKSWLASSPLMNTMADPELAVTLEGATWTILLLAAEFTAGATHASRPSFTAM